MQSLASGRKKAAPVAWTRAALVALLVVFVGLAAYNAAVLVPLALRTTDTFGQPTVGSDFAIYLARAHDWLAGDGFYRAHQLAGPYAIEQGDSLYPPTLLLLVVPFALGLPLPLWWVIPVGITAYAVIRHRPALWAWVLIAAVFCYWRPWVALIYGNPSIWVVAAVAAGTVWGWPAVFALVKPTLAPFALIGIRGRSWWVALAASGVVAALFAPLWLQYVHVALDARNQMGSDYIWGEIPQTLVPVIAWLGRRRPDGAPAHRYFAWTAPSVRT